MNVIRGEKSDGITHAMQHPRASLRVRGLQLLFTCAALSAGSLCTGERLPAQSQVPPLPVRSGDACTIVDAKPLLAAREYANAAYSVRALSDSPLVLKESVNLNDGLHLDVEQRGCVDRYAKFTFAFSKIAATQSRRANLQRIATALRSLELDAHAIFQKMDIDDVAHAVEEDASSDRVVCFQRVGNECIRDVSVRYEFPQVEAFFVDRP